MRYLCGTRRSSTRTWRVVKCPPFQFEHKPREITRRGHSDLQLVAVDGVATGSTVQEGIVRGKDVAGDICTARPFAAKAGDLRLPIKHGLGRRTRSRTTQNSSQEDAPHTPHVPRKSQNHGGFGVGHSPC